MDMFGANMRISLLQFQIMVEFMEKYGDLETSTTRPQGRLKAIRGWDELTALLNSEGAGRARTAEIWKKVWSNVKQNTKHKQTFRLHRSATGAGVGSATTSRLLTDLEHRVNYIIGIGAAVGLEGVAEPGFPEDSALDMEKPMKQLSQPPSRCSTTGAAQEWVRPSTSFGITSRSPQRRPLTSPRRIPHTSSSSVLRRRMNAAAELADETARRRREIENIRRRQRERERDLDKKWAVLMRNMLDLANKALEK